MYNQNENRYNDPPERYVSPRQRSVSRMAIASIACGIIGIFCFMTGFFAVFFGALGMLFAALSKGEQKRPERLARYGRVIGLIAIFAGVAMMIFSVTTVINQYGSLENYYNSYIESMAEDYGIDLGSNSNV